MVYTSHTLNISMPIIREFEEHTGIWVNVVSGGTSEMLEKIRNEQNAPLADIMLGDDVESLIALRQSGSDTNEFILSAYETLAYARVAYAWEQWIIQ